MPKGIPPWLGVAGLVIVIDQVTKQAVLQHFLPGEGVVITSFFNLILAFNRGAAFSFLAEAGGWQKWFFVILATGISVWIVGMLRKHSAETLLALALSLILGGALGNVIDRLIYGAVVDFLDFHAAGWHFPAFNVADSAITVGAILLVWDQTFSARSKEADKSSAKEA